MQSSIFGTSVKFSEKLTFLTNIRKLKYAHQGVKNVSFPENLAHILNECSP